MGPEKLETGYISINFSDIDDAIDEALDALDVYDDRYNYFNNILQIMREIDTSTLGVGVYQIQEACTAIEDKMSAIKRQKNGVAGKKDIVVAFKDNAKNIEETVASHINTTLQDFCDANGIEYEDDDENPIWGFICDIGDAIGDFYEEFKYIIDVIVDVVVVVAAVVGVIVAAAGLAVASGFFAIAAGIAAVITGMFAIYEGACSLFYSSAALHQDLLGNEEEAQRYSNIRDEGAGEYVFVNAAVACGMDRETAEAIYTGIEITMVVLDVFSCTVNLASNIKHVITNFKPDATKFQKICSVTKVVFCGGDWNSGGDFNDAMAIMNLFDNDNRQTIEQIQKIYDVYDKFQSVADFSDSARNLAGALANDEDVFTSLVSFTGDTLGLTPAGEGEFFGLYEDGADLIDLVVGE